MDGWALRVARDWGGGRVLPRDEPGEQEAGDPLLHWLGKPLLSIGEATLAVNTVQIRAVVVKRSLCSLTRASLTLARFSDHHPKASLLI